MINRSQSRVTEDRIIPKERIARKEEPSRVVDEACALKDSSSYLKYLVGIVLDVFVRLNTSRYLFCYIFRVSIVLCSCALRHYVICPHVC